MRQAVNSFKYKFTKGKKHKKADNTDGDLADDNQSQSNSIAGPEAVESAKPSPVNDTQGTSTRGNSLNILNVHGNQYQTFNTDNSQTVGSHNVYIDNRATAQADFSNATMQAGGNINISQIVRNANDSPAIQSWIDAPNPSINFIAAYDKITVGTGEWLLKDSRLIEWKEKGGLLWLQGKAGSGKTFLLTKAIASLKAQNHHVLCFYFDTRDQSKAKATYRGMLASLVLDMGLQFNQTHLKNLYQRYNSGRDQMPADVMKSTLLDMLEQKSSSIYIFMDAFDECKIQDQCLVADFIQQLLGLSINIHIFVTCRYPANHIKIVGTYEISLNEEVVEGDIKTYIQQSLQSRALFSNIKDGVAEVLLHGSHGQIRWVDCQIQYFQQLGSLRAIRKALKSLPKTLEETYEQALNAIKKEHKEDAQAILKWLLFGYEELTMEMLPEIFRIDFEQQTLDDPEPIQGNELCNIISSTLVVVQVTHWYGQKLDILQLGHPSVKEYIVSEEIKASSAKLFHVNDQLAHEFIAQCCLIYLVVCGKDGDINTSQFPLATYAATSWTEYVRSLQALEDPIKSLSLHLLTDTNMSCLAWMNSSTSYNFIQPAAGSALPFYYASMVNLPNMVFLMMHKGADVNAQGGQYGNALQVATYFGQIEIVKLLLKNGADVNAQGGEHGNALQAALLQQRLDIVKLLLENGADVNAQDRAYSRALQVASAFLEASIDIVKLLLENGADVNAQGGQYGNALQAASCRESVDIVKLLIENGAEVNAQGGRYGNALQAASLGGNVAIVKLLLENGADVNAQGGKYGKILQAASFLGHVDTVKLLLENGADVNAQGREYGNALQAASLRGRVDVFKLLLEKGANVNIEGGKYGTALQAASAAVLDFNPDYDYVKSVEVLLDNGADIDSRGGKYGSAVQAAAIKGRRDIFDLLIQRGATGIDPLFIIFQEDPIIPFPLMDNGPADHQIYCPLFWNM
ncbi:hypothetical protein D9758_014173 [Tetrapyrgos nigripes]|uniref:Nephrocystin 3-like N-terminal domain-containing protein n=1 Tax=Tetrapyrgos nigripes TaxID=182062 RepID=A0A8H5FNI7_9AGAR|nr:hypothetical protein D9758_014173 [Tetrapyrgos nigripes]